jgi:hypothetical protein
MTARIKTGRGFSAEEEGDMTGPRVKTANMTARKPFVARRGETISVMNIRQVMMHIIADARVRYRRKTSH